MKKPSRKHLVRLLDKAFSDYIRERDGWKCVTCDQTDRERLYCGHLFSRQAYSTRWSERNAFCQCDACNMRHEYDSYPLTAYFLNEYGREAYDALHRIHRATVKFSDANLVGMIQEYRNKLANLTLTRGCAWN